MNALPGDALRATTTQRPFTNVATLPRQPATARLDTRLLVGLGGVLLAAITGGLNGNVPDIALADVRGALGISYDAGTWLSTLYQATQVAAMAFAPWFAVTFSLRRFTLAAIAALMLLGIAIPLTPNLPLLLTLRALQGIAAGCLPPVLMTAALRFLPPTYRIYGLAGYALTATFGPSLGIPLAALWTEYAGWQFVFWQVVPVSLLSLAMVAWGIPQDEMKLKRFRQFDGFGIATGLPGIALLVIAILQGNRLDWFNSALIRDAFFLGAMLIVVFFSNEYVQSSPFFGPTILKRRNFSHALVMIFGLLIVLSSALVVPAGYLAAVHGYRPLQSAPLGLLIALPQLFILPLVAGLLGLPRVDSRWIMAAGLFLCALSLIMAANITSDWNRNNFYWLLLPHVLGQPMVVVSLLMSSTSVVEPAEGPIASAWFNTVKAFAGAAGSGLIASLMTSRAHFHFQLLVDSLGNRPTAITIATHKIAAGSPATIAHMKTTSWLASHVAIQARVLATADIYRFMAVLAAVLLLSLLVPVRVRPPRHL